MQILMKHTRLVFMCRVCVDRHFFSTEFLSVLKNSQCVGFSKIRAIPCRWGWIKSFLCRGLFRWISQQATKQVVLKLLTKQLRLNHLINSTCGSSSYIQLFQKWMCLTHLVSFADKCRIILACTDSCPPVATWILSRRCDWQHLPCV